MIPMRCWIASCRHEAVFVLHEKTYGDIIAFCRDHRPVLRVFHDADIEVVDGRTSDAQARGGTRRQ